MELSNVLDYANQALLFVNDYVVTALLIIFFGVALGKILGNGLKAALDAVEFDLHVQRVTGRTIPATELLAGFVSAVMYIVSGVWALVQAHIFREVALVFVGILLFFAVLAIILSSFEFIPNLLAKTHVKKALQIGQEISYPHITGTVHAFHTITAELRTQEDERVFIPYVTVQEELASQ